MKKTALIVLDGWGRADNPDVSAIDKANTPFVDSLYKARLFPYIRTLPNSLSTIVMTSLKYSICKMTCRLNTLGALCSTYFSGRQHQTRLL